MRKGQEIPTGQVLAVLTGQNVFAVDTDDAVRASIGRKAEAYTDADRELARRVLASQLMALDEFARRFLKIVDGHSEAGQNELLERYADLSAKEFGETQYVSRAFANPVPRLLEAVGSWFRADPDQVSPQQANHTELARPAVPAGLSQTPR